MSEQRDKMLQRVLNLRAKAENAGSSEAEMNNAFAIAAKLMDAYHIEEAELAIAETEGRIVLDMVVQESDTNMLIGTSHRHKFIITLGGIEAFTGVKSVMYKSSGAIKFTGHRPDVELANYLVAVIREAMDREFDNYRMRTGPTGYGAKGSFQTAMAARINTRLHKMAEEASAEREKNRKDAVTKKQIENSATSSSTALVVCEIAEQKRKETEQLHYKTFPNLRPAAGFGFGKNVSAHGAGKAAGDRVSLNRAIGQQKNTRIG